MKASVFIATSLDGFIAREDGSIDWLTSEQGKHAVEDYGYHAFMESVDALVMGRQSFEKVLTFGEWPYGEKRVVVLSSRIEQLPPPPVKTVEYMEGSPCEIVMRLATSGARHLYIDGGNTIQRFLDAGLIQHLIITRIPVILGKGISLFGPVQRDIHLKHIQTRHYPSGFVQSEYEVTG